MFYVLTQKRDGIVVPSMEGSTESTHHSGSVLIMPLRPDKSGNEISWSLESQHL
jgi:F420-0:gamma-glutamyl ligase